MSTNWQTLEVRLDAGVSADQQYIWGLRYIDDLLVRDRTVNETLDERIYAMQESQWNVIALADASGDVVERFSYHPYGESQVHSSTYTSSSDSYDWQYRFTSREHDLDTGLDYFRNRYWHNMVGVFITRDPLEYVDGASMYVGYFVPSGVDPYGKNDYNITVPTHSLLMPDLGTTPSPEMCVQKLNLCPVVVNNFNYDETNPIRKTKYGEKAIECNVKVYCGNCGMNGKGDRLGGQTFSYEKDNYVYICINDASGYQKNSTKEDDRIAEDRLTALLLHELVHAYDQISQNPKLCQKTSSGNKPKPGNLGGSVVNYNDTLCNKCLDMERRAYQEQAAYLYPNDIEKQAAFVKAGQCYSCSHVCREYAGKPCPSFPK